MKCPACSVSVEPSSAVCPKCGIDLSALHALHDLRESLSTARADTNTISRHLAELAIRASSLEPAISELLAQAHAAKPRAPSAADAAPAEFAHTESPAPAPAAAAPTDARFAAPSREPLPHEQGAEVRLGQKWLLITGLVLTILGVGYFLKYSFDRNWIGPPARVALAYGAGAALIAAGEIFRRKRFTVFGLYLIGGGFAVLYFASYAAFQIYSLINHPVAFGLMAIVTVGAGLFSVIYDTKWLAVLAIIGGFLTPIVLSTATDNQVALMTYMAILNGGILAIAAAKQWPLLNRLGLVFTWLLFTAWYQEHYHESKFWTTTVFLNLFFLTYALVPFAYFISRRDRRPVIGFALTVPNAFVAFAYAFVTIRGRYSLEMTGAASLAYAAVFAVMAALAYRRYRENRDIFVLLLAEAMLFLVLTVPILFSENWVTVFWTIEGAVLLWAALRIGDAKLRTGAVILLLAGVGKLLFNDYARIFALQLPDFSFHPDFAFRLGERLVTVGVALAALFVAGRLTARAGFARLEWQENLAGLFYGVFAVVLFIAVNLEVSSYFHDAVPRARLAAISVLWAVYAAGLMVIGFARHQSVIRWCSIGLFAATILKVVARDMADVETPYRILSFLILGLLLVAASYLYHRFRERILPSPSDGPVGL